MLIKQVVIDGFKSYANRVVIDGWDESFNAITGLNGSGKSNILDAICFVLGISNLAQVRARDLNDLIYKQGTTRVKRAMVTLVFDNTDKNNCPSGLEDKPSFSLARQIAVGQPSKYYLDGAVVPQKKVQTLLQSVKLNVNNPHFLIMQGRVTKVCNMKPDELLGLLEECAGTRMYNQKKAEATLLLARKESKLADIDNILQEDVAKTMGKLRADKANYVSYVANATIIERLERFVAAAEFHAGAETLAAAGSALADKGEAVIEAKARLEKAKNEVETLTATLDRHEQEAKQRGASEAAEEHEKARKVAAACEQAVLHQRADAEAKRNEAKKLAAAAAQGEKRVAAQAGKLAQARAARDAAAEALAGNQERIDSLQSSLVGVAMGGKPGAAGESGSLPAQLIAAQQQRSEAQSELDATTRRIDAAERARASAEAQAAQEKRGFAGLERAVTAAEQALAQARAASSSSTAGSAAAVAQQRARLERTLAEATNAVFQLSADAARAEAQHKGRVAVQYVPWPGLHSPDTAVLGTVAKLVKVNDPQHALALEMAAGGRLLNVVVDNEVTATALIKQGQLQTRQTIIPLTKIQARCLSRETITAAERVAAEAGGRVWHALSLVSYAPAVARAVEFVFGALLVCSDEATANRVAFHPAVRTKCITLRGDVYDPQSGTVSGGSAPVANGPFVLAAAAEAKRAELAARDAHAEQCRGELARLDAADGDARAVEHAEIKLKAAVSARDSSPYASMVREAQDIAREIAEVLRPRAATLTAQTARLADKCQQLQQTIAAMESGSAQQHKALEKELKTAQQAADKLEKDARAAAAAAEKAEQEASSLGEEQQRIAAAIAAAQQAAAEADAGAEQDAVQLLSHKDKVAELKAAVDAEQARLKAENEHVRLVREQRDAMRKQVGDLARAQQELQDALSKLQETKAHAAREMARLASAHKFILTDKAQFGVAGGDYDFGTAQQVEEKKAELKRLKKEQARLQNIVNKKVMTLFEKAEAEYADLVRKRDAVLKDKEKIVETIAAVDQHKTTVLRDTWEKVNASFSRIFATLLPGANSRLDKHMGTKEGETHEIKGVEMRVSFGGVWKQSLSELSGGQRSLLALSLILAMLKYAPAPLYILDEVDAALDLSHTQNIGLMLKEQFPEAQFIVVSLKEGMFNNANVLFRTKFVDGVSTVERIQAKAKK